MPITKSAKKALRRDERRTVVNYRLRAKMRQSIKALKTEKDATKLGTTFSAIDTAAKKHIIHKNKAARLKSRLNKFLTANTTPVAAKKATPKKKTVAKKAAIKKAK